MHADMMTLSPGTWMELPGLRLADAMRAWQDGAPPTIDELGRRVTRRIVLKYYREYAAQMGITAADGGSSLTGVRVVKLERVAPLNVLDDDGGESGGEGVNGDGGAGVGESGDAGGRDGELRITSGGAENDSCLAADEGACPAAAAHVAMLWRATLRSMASGEESTVMARSVVMAGVSHQDAGLQSLLLLHAAQRHRYASMPTHI